MTPEGLTRLWPCPCGDQGISGFYCTAPGQLLEMQNDPGNKHAWSGPGNLGHFRGLGSVHFPQPFTSRAQCHKFYFRRLLIILPFLFPAKGLPGVFAPCLCAPKAFRAMLGSRAAAPALSSSLTAMNRVSQVKELKNRSWETGLALMRDVVNNHKAIPFISSFNSLLCNYIFQ